MSDTKFTPGPWAVSKQKARRVTANGIVICNAVLRNRGGPKHKTYMKDEHEAEANASLLAAAPDLYEALHLVLDTYGFDSSTDSSIWQTVTAALSKARGEA